MANAEWIVIARGPVPSDARKVEFTCTGCGRDALLPVVGLPIAQLADGIVFDIGARALPAVIECPRCGRQLETA